MSLIRITLAGGKKVDLNPLQIKEVKKTKVGAFIADFGTKDGPEINNPGEEGIKITMMDGSSYKTIESLQSFKARLDSSESGLTALTAVLTHLKNQEPLVSNLQAGPLDEKFQEVVSLINTFKKK